MWAAGLGGVCVGQGGLDIGNNFEDGVDAGHAKHGGDVGRRSDENELSTEASGGGVEVDDFAEAGGVHVRDGGEIEDGEEGVVLSEICAVGLEVAEDDGAAEMEDAAGGLEDGGDVDEESLHWKDGVEATA